MRLLFLLLLGHASATPASPPPECTRARADWIERVRPVLNASTATLEVHWADLDRQLDRLGCAVHPDLWLELWRVRTDFDRPADFGTKQWFAKYERCSRIETDLFTFHSVRSHVSNVSRHTSPSPSDDASLFHHVVEEEYLLRLCPCGRRPDQHVCDCEYAAESPLCSGIVQLENQDHHPGDPQGDPRVFSWCKGAEDEVSRIEVKAPVIHNCTAFTLSGTMASCTPIQPYDQVSITLHRINDTVSLCNRETDTHDTANSHRGHTPLVNLNHTHGTFRYEARNLEPDTTYCIAIELKGHPYCTTEHTINNYKRLPVVCASHYKQPVRMTEECANKGGVAASTASSPTFIIILTAVGVLVLCVVIGILCHNLSTKRRQNSTQKLEVIANGKLDHVSAHAGHVSQDHVTQPLLAHADTPEVLLLHFHDTPSSDLNLHLREWGCRVADMDADEHAEDVAADPEGWVMAQLQKENVRVVVVESPLANGYTVTTNGGAVTTNGGAVTNGVINGVTKNTSLVEDSLHELKVFTMKQLQSQFAGNYRQVLVVTYSHGGSRTSHGGSHGGSMTASSVLNSLTPQRQAMLIPERLVEIRQWLQSGGQSSGLGGPGGQSSGLGSDSASQAECKLIEEVQRCRRENEC